MANTYKVYISGMLAGHLIRNIRGQIIFRFTDSYRNADIRPVLGQHFEDDLRKDYQGKGNKLPPFFANLAPEGALRELLEHSLQISSDDELAFISALGRDLPGALEIVPDDQEFDLLKTENDNLNEDYIDPSWNDSVFRFSLAGVQMKFSVLKEGERLALPSTNNLGEWIVKIDSLRFPNLVENEFATLEWARAAGFSVPECHILPSSSLPVELRGRAPKNSNVFTIRRYDRLQGQRIHQEDFAQVVGLRPEQKYEHLTYEQIARLISAICGQEGYFEFIRRLVFMVCSGNTDAHLKNWSLIYSDGINATLTPLYDQVSTIAWPLEKPYKWEWALKLAGTKNLHEINEASFRRLAERSGENVEATLREVNRIVYQIAEVWSKSISPSIMPRQHITRLQKHWEQVPLLNKFSKLIK